jgi:Bacterial lectin
MDQLHEVDCVEPCDAGPGMGDSTVDSTTMADTQSPEVAAPESGADTSTGSTADAGADGPSDAGNSEDAACPLAEIICDGSCVDPASDPLNCNGCGNICHTGLCGTAIAADMETPPPATWLFNGTAVYLEDAGPSAAMTVANSLYQAGTVIYKNLVTVDEFTASFDFRMGYGGGTRNDGMAFMFENTSATSVGTFGESLAVVGLGGYAVEFDINNNFACGDISDDQLGVDSLLNCPDGNPLPTSLFSVDLTTVPIDMADATWHHAAIVLQSGAISVQVDGSPFASGVGLPDFDAGTRYFFGFGGATGGNGLPDGGGGYQTEVRNVAISFPTPRCL